MKYIILACCSMIVFSCQQGTGKKDNSWWEKKILETMNTEQGPDGGGANYADKIEVTRIREQEDGTTKVTFLWWGEFRNGSIQHFQPRKIKGQALIYEFDKEGNRIMDGWQ